jgi:glycosyltransferase involved in cell wall biosynthesis
VRELINERGLEDRIRRIDEQPLPVRAALYAEASVFVYPSLAEGFGLPVLEAMACGAPVVTSNRSSLPEVAGSAAEMCDPTDHVSIGHSLQKVLRDVELADDLRRLGSRRAKDYTWERTAKLTVALYREVLGRQSA